MTLPSTVSTVADTRAGLSQILRGFREVPEAAPVVLGSHRKPEAALMPYATFERLTRHRDVAVPVLETLRDYRALILRLATLNKIASVEVFGSVARGTASPSSDVDLLVEPDPDASYFDLNQFAADVELLIGRRVDVASRRALDAQRDAAILADAVPL